MCVGSYCISYVIWAVWCLAEGTILPPGPYAAFAVKTVITVAVWLGPMVFFLLRRDDRWILSPWQLFAAPFPWLPLLAGLCIAACFLHTAHIILVGVNVWAIFQPIYVWISLAAAVVEELAFRGCFFNRQAAVHGVVKAALLNGVLFAVYHYPEFLVGRNLNAVFGFRFWMIAVMGVVFSCAFARWKHLGMTMVIHFVWNLLCFWFVLS